MGKPHLRQAGLNVMVSNLYAELSRKIAMNRTLVVGDIHGGLKGLVQVMERAKITSADTLIFLGDYVDGWSESAPTIQFLIDLSKKHQCLFIKGNHDYWCEIYLKEGIPNETWLLHGGASTLANYQRLSAQEKTVHLTFLEGMKLYHIDHKDRLFIHAGFTSMKGPQQEFYPSNYFWDRTLWEMALAMNNQIKSDSVIYPKRLKLFTEIYIGHTPTIHFESDTPMNAMNVWNLDTGAAFTGKLTIMDIDTKEFWQSDSLTELYPMEKGRN